MFAGDDIVIDRCLLGGQGGQRPARNRIVEALSSVELRPVSLSPSAILIVRHLDDPMPSEWSLSSFGGASENWQIAVREQLEWCYRHAIRAGNGANYHEADAILFDDEAHLLACLSRDIYHGIATRRWWWRFWLRDLPPLTLPALNVLWSRNARNLPAMVAQLAPGGEDWPMVEAITRASAPRLLHILWQHFQLPWPLSAVRQESSAVSADLMDMSRDESTGNAFPDWLTAIEVHRLLSLASSARQFVLLALALQRRPWQVVSPSWAKTLSRLNAQFEQVSTIASDRVSATASPQASDHTERPQGTPKTSSTAANVSVDAREEQGGISAARLPEAETEPKLASHHGGDRHNDDVPGRETMNSPLHGPVPPCDEKIRETEQDHDESSPALNDTIAARDPLSPIQDGELTSSRTSPVAPFVGEMVARSHLGGVVYLLNLFLQFDLLHSYQHWAGERLAGPWTLLELVTRALLRGEMQSDPLWQCLAMLTHSEPAASSDRGATVECEYIAPDSQQLADRELFWWLEEDQRLWLHNGRWPLRIAACDESCRHDYLATWRMQLSSDVEFLHCRPWRERRFPFLSTDATTAVWLDATVNWLEVFVAEALELPWRNAIDALLRHDATLYLNATHLDLVFDLEAVSLPIRRLAWDRDPGWLPAWGRVVQLHFR